MRKIIHCDADCFFAALEMRDDPSLKGIPMAVGGSPDSRGVISTCNYEARAFGVRSAMASAYAKKLCPQLIIVPHRFSKYKEASEQMRAIFSRYTDCIEPLSLDEAFLDVSDSDLFRGSATLIAEDIRHEIEKSLKITVSAGVAPNKFLAKVGSDWKKPNGLTVIDPARVAFFLKQLPVSAIPGVGPRTLNKLQAIGIQTCNDVLAYELTELVYHFGKFGRRLYELARGEDNRLVEPRNGRKSMSVEHTVAKDLSLEECDPLLCKLVDSLNERKRTLNKGYRINKVFVKVKFMDFSRTTIETLADQLDHHLCLRLFKEAWQRYKKPIRLLGVGVRFNQADMLCREKQLDLFSV